MKLRRVEIDRARGISTSFDVALGLPLVITGPPVSGKTSVLECIVAAKEHAGAYGLPPLVSDFCGASGGAIELKFEMNDEERSVVGAVSPDLSVRWALGGSFPRLAGGGVANRELLRRYELSHSAWKVEYFHAGRGLVDAGSVGWSDPSQRLSKRREKYGWARRFLVEASQRDAASAMTTLRERGIVLGGEAKLATRGFATALAAVAPRLRWVGCERVGDDVSCLFARPEGQMVELAALSDSEKMGVLIAVAYEALGLERSLILIDHPEQGIHPENQAAFFAGLCSLFREGQVIAATTSPAILRAIRREQVVVLR